MLTEAREAGAERAHANNPVKRTDVTLDDKYVATTGKVFISGIQTLARLPLTQRLCDEANGLNTAGFISGYRGSPLGTLDETLWKAKKGTLSVATSSSFQGRTKNWR